MIATARTGHSSRVLPKTELARPVPNGLTVRVLVANIYMGPKLKALPKAEVGDIINVAGGAYAQDLIACGLVTDELAEAAALAELTVAPEPEPWTFLTAAGLTEQQAQDVYAAGFTSVPVILERYQAEGVAPLQAIKGIGKKKAVPLIAWAAVTAKKEAAATEATEADV